MTWMLPAVTSRAGSRTPLRLLIIGLLPLLTALAAATAIADTRQILLDGFFDDWAGAEPLWIDPSGDGGLSGIDLGTIWAAEDDDWFFLRFELGCDLKLHEENSLTLFIDTDNDPSTGFILGAMGAELRWTFGDRSGFFFHGSDWTEITWPDIGLILAPTHSGWESEIGIDRHAVPDGILPLFTGTEIRLMFYDMQGGGDWAPGVGETVAYTLDTGSADPWEVVDLEPAEGGGLRIVTYNVRADGLFTGWKQPSFERILQAIDPDVIAFQELYEHGATQTRLLIEEWLGGSWSAQEVNDNILLTRSTVADYWSIAGGRAGGFLITPLGSWEHDLLVINAHLSCCGNDDARQEQVDAIMAFVRDARTAGGDLDLTPENPIIITGDMNFVGWSRQLETLLTGDIVDEGTYGPDFAPDWDETNLADVISRHPSWGVTYSWYNEISDYSPGRLDFFIVTDSNLLTAKSLILQTSLMPAWLRSAYGLNETDTDYASDHLPHFGDLQPSDGGAVDWQPEIVADLSLVLRGPRPAAGPVRLQLSLPTGVGGLPAGAALTVHDPTGRQVSRLLPARHSAGQVDYVWNGRDGGGRSVPAGTYWFRLKAGKRALCERVLIVR